MDLELLKSKFRGTMLGVLVGDVLGSPYEGKKVISCRKKIYLQRRLDTLEGTKFREPVMEFTDDSAMTRSLAESLIEKRDLDIVDIAKRFVENYYQEPYRGYGTGSISVLKKLRKLKNKKIEPEIDVKGPAKAIFDGRGSYGNGGAMKIAPVSLYSYNNYDNLLHYVKEVTQITHAHELGINGAILQAIAIQQSLCLHPSEELNVSNFIDDLINKMDKIEVESQPYKERLKRVKNLLSDTRDEPNEQRIAKELGNNVRALESVPTAIFCFLKAQKRIKRIRTNNPVRRAIQYAITLGGDTDTIASMTGAIAGAFYGHEKFSRLLLSHCEQADRFEELADELLGIATSKS
ncbi:Poly(ADP-ribose) glycohydrolase ARH3 [Camponotus floridanus]|uniref:ADP-ribosylhydrolase ARH3 n=1 Tax=Camponotus floridanus TaxID=104421 RepID=E2AAU0_CAMFO|nr:poly(ADP-ribose) glycohydrolase ARH3-like isoform X3 [Camponotus floridanus]EFN69445.1 Poly(ADP-ribose) glycohydrolase ARH3 [Camponotus floridanus]